MNLAPVTALFTRSLMLRTRAVSVAWMRLILGLVLLLSLLGSEMNTWVSAKGLNLLSVIAYFSVWALAIPALTSFSSAITEEKEENAIGLLRMAGLHPLGILLAKSVARLLEVLVLMAITLPVALLAVTLGGVTAVQVLAVYIALSTWLLLLANLAVFWSVLCRTSANAASATFLSLILVPMLFGFLVLLTGSQNSPMEPVGAWLFDQTVFMRLARVLRTGYAGGVMGLSDLVHLVGSAVLFLMAWRLFPRYAVDADGGEGGRPWLMFTGRKRSPWKMLLGAGRPPPGLAALTWKDFHFLVGGSLGQILWLMAIFGLALFIAYINEGSRLNTAQVVGGFMMITVLLLLPFQIGLSLARLFSEERRLGTIGDILGLPYHPTSMVYAKLRSLRWPLLSAATLFGVGAVLAPEALWDGGGSFFRRGFGFAVIAVVLAFWHWCAYLSMCLKSGAFISSLVVTGGSLAVLGVLLSFSRFSRGDDMAAGLIAVFYGFQAFILHLFLRERFQRMAND